MTTNMILAAQGQAGGGYSMIIMMVAIFAIMYFFMIRPQQKKQKEIRNFQNSIKEGTKVITAGGMYGTVRRVILEQNALELEVAKGVTITVDRNYVFADAASQQQK
ncbi:MAG: preprotein translocase subunit YajC [Prevotellaceae bacterium]|nr:preprotein translocase subunit YajC [Prevotella sp.]MDD7247324.1 preprotein translocase subunit YajC [Prevotellaceae bacterium]MDY2749042.1 preprotein translocase subunit YajC [Prevotella sp.]